MPYALNPKLLNWSLWAAPSQTLEASRKLKAWSFLGVILGFLDPLKEPLKGNPKTLKNTGLLRSFKGALKGSPKALTGFLHRLKETLNDPLKEP